MNTKLSTAFALLLLFSLCSGFKRKPKNATAHLFIRFENFVGNRPLKLNDSLNKYTNANGDDFYITTFKYYVSNIVLTKKNGETVSLPESYFLINAADSSTWAQELRDVPEGKYKSIRFIIGVDSLRNFAGAQTGLLDPSKGMFWTWKSGYIFVKMEGVSGKSTSKKNRLTFHIGGAIAPENTIRSFAQDFPKTLKIRNEKDPQIDIAVNAAALFKGKTTVDFSKLNFTMGGPQSVIIADNYANGLFTVTNVRK